MTLDEAKRVYLKMMAGEEVSAADANEAEMIISEMGGGSLLPDDATAEDHRLQDRLIERQLGMVRVERQLDEIMKRLEDATQYPILSDHERNRLMRAFDLVEGVRSRRKVTEE